MTRFEVASPVINAEMKKPYRYGESDCFFFGCRVADAFDPSRALCEKYAGIYTTLLGAQKALRKRGFERLADLFANHLTPIGPAMAQYGDVAVLSLDGADHVAVCVGSQFMTRTEKGASLYPLSFVSAAFRT
jgi:hypothetical protein